MIERFLNRAIDEFLSDPDKTLAKLEEMNVFEGIAEIRSNPGLIKTIYKWLAQAERKTSIRILLHLYRSLNKKPKLLHFDFIKKPLGLKELGILFAKTNLLYACFFLKEEIIPLLRFLGEADALFFLFLEEENLGREAREIITRSGNLFPIFPAISFKEAKGLLCGAQIHLNNRNLPYYANEGFLTEIKAADPTFLVYIREEKLNPKNRRQYGDFLKKYRFRHFPLIDFHWDQRKLLEKLVKMI